MKQFLLILIVLPILIGLTLIYIPYAFCALFLLIGILGQSLTSGVKLSESISMLFGLSLFLYISTAIIYYGWYGLHILFTRKIIK